MSEDADRYSEFEFNRYKMEKIIEKVDDNIVPDMYDMWKDVLS